MEFPFLLGCWVMKHATLGLRRSDRRVRDGIIAPGKNSFEKTSQSWVIIRATSVSVFDNSSDESI